LRQLLIKVEQLGKRAEGQSRENFSLKDCNDILNALDE